jgi:hypothetical protein
MMVGILGVLGWHIGILGILASHVLFLVRTLRVSVWDRSARSPGPEVQVVGCGFEISCRCVHVCWCVCVCGELPPVGKTRLHLLFQLGAVFFVCRFFWHFASCMNVLPDRKCPMCC